MTQRALISITFEMEHVDCINYRVVSKEELDLLLSYCQKNPNTVVCQAYSNPSPIEIVGDEFTGSSFLESLDIQEDEEAVKAFEFLFDSNTFFTGDDIIGQVFNHINNDLISVCLVGFECNGYFKGYPFDSSFMNYISYMWMFESEFESLKNKEKSKSFFFQSFYGYKKGKTNNFSISKVGWDCEGPKDGILTNHKEYCSRMIEHYKEKGDNERVVIFEDMANKPPMIEWLYEKFVTKKQPRLCPKFLINTENPFDKVVLSFTTDEQKVKNFPYDGSMNYYSKIILPYHQALRVIGLIYENDRKKDLPSGYYYDPTPSLLDSIKITLYSELSDDEKKEFVDGSSSNHVSFMIERAKEPFDPEGDSISQEEHESFYTDEATEPHLMLSYLNSLSSNEQDILSKK